MSALSTLTAFARTFRPHLDRFDHFARSARFASIAPAALCALALLAGSLGAGIAAGADDYATWAHTRNLYTNTSPDGAYVIQAVKRFPLLVRLDSGNFAFAEALKRGQDVRFSDSAGKHLPYQIERWDSTGKAAEVWVLLDSVPGNAYALALRMHWGRADAADSSNGAAVFDSADGSLAVWHLGGADTLGRANAVAGGNPAKPVRYDGDESRLGIIGLSDSLDGTGEGDYLDLGQGYADLNKGFTYSVWVAPSNRAFWSRLLDMGNGAPLDNLVLQRHLTTDDVDFDAYNGTAGLARVKAVAALAPGEWHHFAVTVGNKTASFYRNGVLVASEKQGDTLPAVLRTLNYIGKSNWAGNNYFQGRIDEARLCKVVRGADWIKLGYANQKAGQSFLSFNPPTTGGCATRFEVPKDTAIAEGSPLELAGVADCADSYYWTLVSGPGPRILDPEVRSLHIAAPRVVRDVELRYRFSARYLGATLEKDIGVLVKEAIPDPAFSLPALTWNGKDSLLVAPSISNLAAIKATHDSILNFSWTVSGTEADTAWREGGLLLKASPEGALKIGLCLDNGGEVVCKSVVVTVGAAAGLLPVTAFTAAPARKAFDAGGRRLQPAGQRHPRPVFRFFR